MKVGLIKKLIEFMDILKGANKQLYIIHIVRTEIATIYFLVCPIKVINNSILQVTTSMEYNLVSLLGGYHILKELTC